MEGAAEGLAVRPDGLRPRYRAGYGESLPGLRSGSSQRSIMTTHPKAGGRGMAGSRGSQASAMELATRYLPRPPTESLERAGGRRLAHVLLLSQALLTGFCLAGDLAPSPLYPSIARVQIVTQMFLGVVLIVVVLDRGRDRPRLIVNGGLLLASVALVGRFIISDGSIEIYIDNSIRLMLPICAALVFAGSLDLVKDAIWWIRRHSRMVDICAIVALTFMFSARVLGEHSYWPGYPVQPFLAYPLVFNEKKICFRRLALYTLAMAMSGRRTGLIVWLLGLVVGALAQDRGKLRSLMVVTLGVGAIWYGLVLGGLASSVETRTRSAFDQYSIDRLSTATSTSEEDRSIGQRMEEIRAEIDGLLASPASVAIGRDLVEVVLDSGRETHAIHCTPVFFLARGGLLWLLALVTLPRYRRVRLESSVYVGAGVTLAGSIAGNSTLDLGFLIALAMLVQLRGHPRNPDAAAYDRPSRTGIPSGLYPEKVLRTSGGDSG